MSEILMIALTAALLNNVIFAQMFGVGALLNMSTNAKSAAGMGVAVTVVLIATSATTWAVGEFLRLFRLYHLQLVVFVFIIAVTVYFIAAIVRRFMPNVSRKGYFPVLTANSAILGLAILNNFRTPYVPGIDFATAMVSGAFAGIGFLIAAVLLAAIRERVELQGVPKSFSGVPIALISVGLIALVFWGLV